MNSSRKSVDDYGKSVLYSIGVFLAYVGVSIGGLIKLLFQTNFSWISSLILILSLVFLFDYKRMLKFHIPNWPICAIFIYSIITLTLCLLSEARNQRVYGFTYQIVYFLQIVLVWNNYKRIDSDNICKVFFWGSLASSVLALFLILRYSVGHGSLAFNFLITSSETTIGVSRTTIGAVGFCSFISCLTFMPKKQYEKVCKVLAIIFAIFVLGLSTRRSCIIAAVVGCVIYIRDLVIQSDKKSIHVVTIKRVIISVGFLFVAVLTLYYTNETIRIQIDRVVELLFSGFQTYMGVENSDLSASYRRAHIVTKPMEFLNANAKDFFFGKGYLYEWLDIPFLEAFIDLGFFGGIYYVILMGVLVIKNILFRTNSRALTLARLMLILSFIQGFVSGAPYGNFLPLVLFYAIKERVEEERVRMEGIGINEGIVD